MPTTLSNMSVLSAISALVADVCEGVPCIAGVRGERSFGLGFGSGAGLANQFAMFSGQVITAGNSVNFTVNTLEGLQPATDPLKNAVAILQVHGLLIHNRPTSIGNLILGGAAATPWTSPFNGSGTSKLKLFPGCAMFFTAKNAGSHCWQVTEDVQDILKLEASGGDVAIDVWLLGDND
jgi:hypothetical protein